MKELYRAEQLPIFQNRMFDTQADAKNCKRGDVILVQDPLTGLVYNRAFRPELMCYDESYQNEQACSTAFKRHLQDIAALTEREFSGATLLEVGCGKGYFLELLESKGWDIHGLDPTYQGSNPRIRREYFNQNSAMRADGILLRHVLEHVQNPVPFLAELAEANGGSGKIYIEVPCLDWICEHRAWFDIFYEHVNYFRLEDFRRIFGNVSYLGHSFGGQYLSVVADLASLRTPTAEDKIQFPEDFLATVQGYATHVQASKRHSVVWGGASKGVIFSLLLERAGVTPGTVIDINPAKQGKYLAGTGLLVEAWENAKDAIPTGADIYVMNRNYLPEIMEMTEGVFNYHPVER